MGSDSGGICPLVQGAHTENVLGDLLIFPHNMRSWLGSLEGLRGLVMPSRDFPPTLHIGDVGKKKRI